MAALILCYDVDPLGKVMDWMIRANSLSEYGYRTETSEPVRHAFGKVVYGRVFAGEQQRTFVCALLNRDVGALGVAIKLGYTARNSILAVSATEAQIATMKKSRRSFSDGYVIFDREEVPCLGEWYNAVLFIRETLNIGEVAARIFRGFVFPEKNSRRRLVRRMHSHHHFLADLSI